MEKTKQVEQDMNKYHDRLINANSISSILFGVMKYITISSLYFHKDISINNDIILQAKLSPTKEVVFTYGKKYSIHRNNRSRLCLHLMEHNITFVIYCVYNLILCKDGKYTIIKMTDIDKYKSFFDNDISHIEYNIMQMI